MTKRIENTGAFKRVMLALVVLLVAATLMVGAVSAADSVVNATVSINGAQATENLTLADAFAYAVDQTKGADNTNTAVITLLNDVTEGGLGLFYTQGHFGCDITLDLNGQIYTCKDPAVGSSGTETQGLHFERLNTILIKNGTINVSEDVTETKFLLQNYCDLTLDNVTLDGSNLAGTKPYTSSNNFGNLTLQNHVVIKAPESGVALDVWYGMNAAGLYDDGVSVVIADNTVSIDGKVEYGNEDRITDEKQFRSKAILKIAKDYEPFTVTASGSFPLTDYAWVESDDGMLQYTLPAAAQIGDKKYDTLEEAVASIVDTKETTIKLLRDETGNGIVVGPANAGKTIIFDLNGYNYTVGGSTVGSSGTKTNCFQLLNGNDVTFMNGELRATTPSAKIFLQNYANLTLDNVKVYGAADTQYVSSNNCGNTVYKGNTALIAKGENYAFDLYYWPENGYTDGVSVMIKDSTVTITGMVGFTCDGTDTAQHFEQATLLVPVGYEDKLTLRTCDHNDFIWGVSDKAGMTKVVPVTLIDPATDLPIDTVTKDYNGNTTITATTGETIDVVDGNVAVISGTDVTLKVTFKETIASANQVTGNVSTVEASYTEVDDVATPTLSQIATPDTVSIALNITLGNVTELPAVSTTFNATLASEVTTEYVGYFPVAMLTGESITEVNSNITEIEIIFTVPKAWVDSMGGKDSGRIFFFHITDAGVGTPQKVAGENIVEDGTNYKIKVYGSTFSTYALAGIPAPVTPPKDTGSGSSSSGSSVWLQEPVTPTETPTEQPTDKPTDTVPTDIPSTQPTATPASPGFGILAALAGLGAIAVLRRQ